MKQMQVTNESLHHSKALVGRKGAESFFFFFLMEKMIREKYGGVLWCRVRCDVFTLQVKAMAAWADRAVYHTVLW